MSALADYRMLWSAAVVQRFPRQVAWALRTGTVAMLLLGGLDAALKRDWASALIVGSVIPWVMLVCFLVFAFVPGAVLLNTPANARLVPRMRARLMQMTALAWIVSALLPALVMGTSVTNVVGCFVGVAIWIIGFGLARGGYRLGGGLQVMVVVCVIAWSKELRAMATPALMALAILLVMAIGALALRAIYPRSSERHWKLRGRIERVRELAAPGHQFQAHDGTRWWTGLYRWALQRDSVRGRSDALLLHVLGPASHWTQLCLPLGVLLAAAVIAKFVFSAFASAEAADILAGIGWAFATALMCLQMIDLERVAARLAATPCEQALLRLTARSAPGAGFNRRLGRALLRYALLDWAMVSAAAMCLTALSGANAYILVMQACLCCLGLPLVAALLRDYARGAGMMGWWLLASGIVAGLLSGAAGMLASRLLGLPGWPVMALASAALALLAVGWRWRAMAAAPVAFPVARLA